MQHRLSIDGLGYSLRPVQLTDARFILKIRLEYMGRTQYIHEIPDDIELEENWIRKYFQRNGDFFFIIENKITGQPEGTIAIYDMEDGRAEWGRWVVQKGSLAAAESVDLIYKVAFQKLNLRELYCRTIEKNSSVVSFHDSLPQKRRGILKDFFELRGELYNAVEHYVDKEYYLEELSPVLEKKAFAIFQRNLRTAVGKFQFHHIGVACSSLERDRKAFQFLGYQAESPCFTDSSQGIMGQFMVANNQPRIELLQNLEGSTTLTPYLEKGVKLYHFAYSEDQIEKACEYLVKCRAKMMSPLKESVYFGKRICFLMLSNMFLIELVEE